MGDDWDFLGSRAFPKLSVPILGGPHSKDFSFHQLGRWALGDALEAAAGVALVLVKGCETKTWYGIFVSDLRILGV